MDPDVRVTAGELLFPVIAWYDIIDGKVYDYYAMLLFPVIAWYDIILSTNR